MRTKLKNLRNGLLALLVLASTPLATNASAESNTTAADLHCLAVASMMAGNTDQHMRSTGVVMNIYYLGRLDGSTISVDIKNGLKNEFLKMTPKEFQTGQTTCRALLVSRGNFLAEVSKYIEDQGKTAPSVQMPSSHP